MHRHHKLSSLRAGRAAKSEQRKRKVSWADDTPLSARRDSPPSPLIKAWKAAKVDLS